jgi:hypothetical protein
MDSLAEAKRVRRNVRRMGVEEGEQYVILKATETCSDAEWNMLYEAIVACVSAKYGTTARQLD